MAPLPSRKSLESMKRVDLQKICKDYGVRANLKSEALIDLLLDTQSSPAPQPIRRSASTRLPSKAGPSRVSSMIVHDISEEEDDANADKLLEEASPVPTPPIRTRKAKELQTRLGVGKPVVAGGQGPRAVTRSSGSSRGKHAKLSRAMKPLESTIEEEPETGSVPSKDSPKVNEQEDAPTSQDQQSSIPTSNSTSNNLERLEVKKIVDDAIRPLQDQIRTLKSEVDHIQSIKSEIAELQVQVTEVCKAQKDMKDEFAALHELSDLVVSLKEEIKQLREGVSLTQSPSRPSTPKPKTGQARPSIGFGLPPAFRNSIAITPVEGIHSQNQSNFVQTRPGIETTLGKRHRNSTESNITGIVEEGQEDEYSENELAKKVVRPNKKRPRIAKDNNSDDGKTRIRNSSRVLPNSDDELQAVASSSNHVPATFTVFRGSEEPTDFMDPPPPTDHLPDFFRPDSPPNTTSNPQGSRTTGVSTSSALAAENQQHPFGFSFHPTSSTPQIPMFLPTFAYPEPPQSPSPAGPSTGIFSGRHHDERTDIFKSFGFPSPLRSTRHYGSLQDDRGGFVNPAALSQGTSGRQREVSSNDVAAGLGLTAVRTASSSETASAPTVDPLPSKRTMYGTELESDTRFGDFGVEGVASGYWTNGGKF